MASASKALARYDQMLTGMHNSELLLAPIRRQEAVISSRIEGTVSTLDEVLRKQTKEKVGRAVLSEPKPWKFTCITMPCDKFNPPLRTEPQFQIGSFAQRIKSSSDMAAAPINRQDSTKMSKIIW